MLGICLTCGLDADDVEGHHVAGRANHPTLTVPVCADCHRILSAWQRASGVALGHDPGRADVDRMRALAVGTLALFRLAAQRHPSRSLVGSLLVTLTERVVSRLLDLAAPFDRPGRWLPDPTQPPTEALPVDAMQQTESDLVVLFATLTAEFLALVGDNRDHAAISVLRAIADDADGVHGAWQELQRDPAQFQGLCQDLQAQGERCQRIVSALLVADPDTEPGPNTVDDLRASVHTGRRLSEVLVALTERAATK